MRKFFLSIDSQYKRTMDARAEEQSLDHRWRKFAKFGYCIYIENVRISWVGEESELCL